MKTYKKAIFLNNKTKLTRTFYKCFVSFLLYLILSYYILITGQFLYNKNKGFHTLPLICHSYLMKQPNFDIINL